MNLPLGTLRGRWPSCIAILPVCLVQVIRDAHLPFRRTRRSSVAAFFRWGDGKSRYVLVFGTGPAVCMYQFLGQFGSALYQFLGHLYVLVFGTPCTSFWYRLLFFRVAERAAIPAIEIVRWRIVHVADFG